MDTASIIADSVYEILSLQIPLEDREERSKEYLEYQRKDYVYIYKTNKHYGVKSTTRYVKPGGGSIILEIDFYDDKVGVLSMGNIEGPEYRTFEYADPDCIKQVAKAHKRWLDKVVVKPRLQRIRRRMQRQAVRDLKEYFEKQAAEAEKKRKEKRTKARKATK